MIIMNKKAKNIRHPKLLGKSMCRHCGYISAGELARLNDAIKISVPSSIVCSRIHALKGAKMYADVVEKLQNKLEQRSGNNGYLIRVRSVNRITMSVKDARDMFGSLDGMPRTAFMLKKR